MKLMPVNKFVEKNAATTAIIVTLLLFLAMNIFFVSLLNSADDAFIMYPIGGGYGSSPTNLLYYRSGWHYWLGSLVQWLFTRQGNINWYSITLLTYHFAGCAFIFWVALKRLRPGYAFFFYGLVFYFIETKLLLSLTYTGASLVASIGAGFLLLHQFEQRKLKSIPMISALLLLLLAGLLRMHVVLLCSCVLVVVSLILLRGKEVVLFFATVGGLVLVLLLCYRAHENYYRTHIPRWEKQEQFSQSLIYIFNRPVSKDRPWQEIFTDTIERDFFSAGLYYDSTHFTKERLDAIGAKITRKRWMNKKQDWDAIIWIFNDAKVFLVLIAGLFISLWVQGKKKQLFRWLLILLPVLASFAYLFVFTKITPALQFGFLMMAFVFPVLLFNKQDSFSYPGKYLSRGAIGLFVLLCVWRGARIVEQHWINVRDHKKFLCAAKELALHPDQLFLSTDDNFPVSYFYIWDSPQKYPMKNIIYKNWWLSNGYPGITRQFGINTVNDLFKSEKVFLLGKPLDLMKTYYPGKKPSPILPGYGCLEVRRLVADE